MATVAIIEPNKGTRGFKTPLEAQGHSAGCAPAELHVHSSASCAPHKVCTEQGEGGVVTAAGDSLWQHSRAP